MKKKKEKHRVALKSKDKEKATVEKGRAPRKAAEEKPERLELPGLALLAVAVVSLISLLSEYARGEGANILGPYLGHWWAAAMNQAVGTLPVLFYVAAVSVMGVQLLFGKSWWRTVLIVASMGFFVGLLLSIRFLGLDGMAVRDFESSGGW